MDEVGWVARVTLQISFERGRFMSDRRVSRVGGYRNCRPRLEGLESRELLAVRVTEVAGVLNIQGDNKANQVIIYDGEDVPGGYSPGRLEVRYDGGKSFTPSGPISSINVDLQGGNDSFSYYLGDSQPSPYGQADSQRTLRVSTGNGNDKVYVQLSGFGYGDGNSPSSIGEGRWDLRFDLGSGNDQFKLDQYASLTGTATNSTVSANDVYLLVNGGAGNDVMEANFAAVSISNSYYDVVMRGGAGNDTMTMRSYGLVSMADSTVNFDRYGEAGDNKLFGQVDYQLASNTKFGLVLDSGNGRGQVKAIFKGQSRKA